MLTIYQFSFVEIPRKFIIASYCLGGDSTKLNWYELSKFQYIWSIWKVTKQCTIYR